ncbi:MAG TPA: mercuric transporter MerT family protein [Verrucomicrobiae bacterium]|nr:mercuric transporter MerT family protein [Verrucomicrobiae bacterium]
MDKLKARWAIGGSVVTAITASACCIGPIAAAALGVGGFAASAVFEKWRPLFLLLTFGLLGAAWYAIYKKPRACRDSASCPASPASKWNRVSLWLATGFVLATAAFPAFSRALFRPAKGPTCCEAPVAKHVKNQTGFQVEPARKDKQ